MAALLALTLLATSGAAAHATHASTGPVDASPDGVPSEARQLPTLHVIPGPDGPADPSDAHREPESVAGDEVSCGGIAPIQRHCGARDRLEEGEIQPFIDTAFGYHGWTELTLTSATGFYHVECFFWASGLFLPNCTTPDRRGTFLAGQMASLTGRTELTPPSVGQWEVGFSPMDD